MEYLKRPKKYVDFDGVIKDTYMPLFEDYLEKKKKQRFHL